MTLDKQVHEIEVRLRNLEARMRELEKDSHKPYDFTEIERRLKELEDWKTSVFRGD